MRSAILFFCFLTISIFPNLQNKRHNRFYVGTEVFYHDLKESYTSPSRIEENGLIKGIIFGYDYTKPFSIYAGVNITYDESTIYDKNNENLNQIDSKNQINNYEARTGFNIPFGYYFLLTPFVGYGYNEWTRNIDEAFYMKYDKLNYKWEYVAYGVRLLALIYKYIDVGLYIKIFEMVKVDVKVYENEDYSNYQTFQQRRTPKYKLDKKSYYQIEFPIYIHPPGSYIIDIGIIPFIRNIRLEKGNELKFFQNTLSPSPSSKAYEYGAKIELGLSI